MIDLFSVLPIPLLEKLRWQEIVAEYDPYKFSSFPVNASRQVNRAIRSLQRALEDGAKAGRLAQMPPVVTWQSVVDSTVGAVGAADTLYAQLQGPGQRLVLFDLNRQRALRSVTRPAARALIERLTSCPRGFTLEVVTNPDPQSGRVSVQRFAPEGAQTVRDTALVWPASLVSLGHVALLFPPDDPVYGFLPGSGRDGIPSIGSWLLRGESGAITIALVAADLAATKR